MRRDAAVRDIILTSIFRLLTYSITSCPAYNSQPPYLFASLCSTAAHMHAPRWTLFAEQLFHLPPPGAAPAPDAYRQDKEAIHTISPPNISVSIDRNVEGRKKKPNQVSRRLESHPRKKIITLLSRWSRFRRRYVDC